MARAPVREHCNCDWRRAPDVDPDQNTRPCDGVLVREEPDPLEPVSGVVAHCPECGSRFENEGGRGPGDRCGTRLCRHCGGLI